MLIKDVINYLESRFPISNAEDFDQPKLGLVIGSENITLSNIMLTLDMNLEVLEEAITKGCNLIISHHPYLFTPLSKVLFESPKAQVLRKMFEHQISLYCMHTNLDVGLGGVNDVLANKLKFKNIKTINNEANKGNYLRYGTVDQMTVSEYAKIVKKELGLNGVRVSLPNKKIKTVGVVGGSGAHPYDIQNAISVGCDCYVTGEVKLNIAQEAKELGLAIIEVNHGTEKFVFEQLQIDLKNDLELNEVFITSVNTDPMNFE